MHKHDKYFSIIASPNFGLPEPNSHFFPISDQFEGRVSKSGIIAGVKSPGFKKVGTKA